MTGKVDSGQLWSLTCCKERPDFTPGPAVMGIHGLGYANEVWDKSLFEKIMAGLELALMDEKNWSPTTATNSVALFYWRLRWGGNASPMERIRFVGSDSLAKLRKF